MLPLGYGPSCARALFAEITPVRGCLEPIFDASIEIVVRGCLKGRFMPKGLFGAKNSGKHCWEGRLTCAGGPKVGKIGFLGSNVVESTLLDGFLERLAKC